MSRKRVSLASRRQPPCRRRGRRARRSRREGCADRARSATALAAARTEARSSSVKPPSGPTRISAGAGLEGVGRRARRPFRRRNTAAVRLALVEQALERDAARRSRGSRVRPHCSAASIAIASSRSSFTRSAIVRWVITGISRAAPSSVAFSTSQSVCARLTGANASQTSGIALRLAGPALDGRASCASCPPRRSAPAIRPDAPSNTSSSRADA